MIYGNYFLENSSLSKFKFIDIDKDEAKPYLKSYYDYNKYKNHIDLFKGEICIDKEKDKLAGIVMVYKKKYPGFITPLEVMKEYRGQGLGKKLLKDAINKYGAIDLVVDKTNKIAISLYKKNGFITLENPYNKSQYYMKLKSKVSSKDKVITESKKLDIPQEIIDFNKTLNKDFSYGVVYKGKVITNLSKFNFWDDYKSLTIREFEKYKTGVCWDYVHYEANWFKKNGYKYETYYIEGLDKDGDMPTHTFLLFYLNDSSKTYYFESSWGKYRGIEEFDSTTKALNTIKERHMEQVKGGNIKDIIIVKNDFTSTSFEGLSCGDYMIKASKGKTRLSLDESAINEANSNITFSNSFNDVKNIVDTLSDEELHHICSGTFKNSPYVVYRKVLKYNNIPAAFIDIYSIPEEMDKDEAVVVVACKNEYRGNGYTDMLIKDALKSLKKSKKIKKLYWETTKSNKASSTIAKRNGFVKSKDINKDDDNYFINL